MCATRLILRRLNVRLHSEVQVEFAPEIGLASSLVSLVIAHTHF